jgi:4-carboxymuconolactone decarboxylase
VNLPPLAAENWDDEVLHALRMIPEERRNPVDAGNALATFVHHPELTRAYLGFSFYLLRRSTLEPRLRELAVLRVAHLSACAYEWDEHVAIGQAAGLSPEDVDALQRGEAADDVDRLVLTAVDELVEQTKMSDATWAVLGQHLDKRQLMDFVFTVGGYQLLAMALNTFGVEPKKEN